MSNLYYRISDPSDVRDLGDQMTAWELADNPKRNDWAAQGEPPSADAVWADGAWSVPPVATLTAEEAVSKFFTPYQTIALQRFEMALMTAGKPLGPKMTAAKQWLESVMLAWAVDPTPQESFGQPAATFEESSAEAVADLAG